MAWTDFINGLTEFGGLDDVVGDFIGEDLGAAISGYGIGEATGGNGLLSAATSALGSRLGRMGEEQTYSERRAEDEASEGEQAAAASEEVETGGGGGTGVNDRPSISGSLSKKLQDMGIINSDGEGTLLGKSLVAGAQGMAEQKTTEDLLEQKQENALEREEHYRDLEHENEQRRIAAFSNGPTFKVTRNN